VVRVSPQSAAPGDPVNVYVACGACLSIGIVDGRAHPPRSVPVTMLPLSGESSSHYLGEALPTFRESELESISARREYPRYRLRARIPDVEAGTYAFLPVHPVRPGERISAQFSDPVARLRVTGAPPQAREEGGTGTGVWLVGVAGAGLLALVAALFLSQRRSRRHPVAW
jgi:hypothetical protein